VSLYKFKIYNKDTGLYTSVLGRDSWYSTSEVTEAYLTVTGGNVIFTPFIVHKLEVGKVIELEETEEG
jgi:hypothetical protein